MFGFRRRSAAPLSGWGFLGDSNTSISYMALPEQFVLGTATTDLYEDRWTQKLAAATGWRIENLGQDGAQAEDFLGQGAPVQTIPAATVGRWWRAHRCKYYGICFGLNETAKTIPEFRADVQKLRDEVLAFGATPVMMTNVSVFFDADKSVAWYNTNRNIVIDSYDDVLRGIAAESPDVLLADVNAAFKAEIAGASYDHRARADGTLTDVDDHLHVGDPDFANWRTNIHYNEPGCQVVADVLEALIISEGLSET